MVKSWLVFYIQITHRNFPSWTECGSLDAPGALQPGVGSSLTAQCRQDCPSRSHSFLGILPSLKSNRERNSYLNAPALLQGPTCQDREGFVPSLLQEQAVGAVPQSKLDILVKNQLTLTEENLDKQEKKRLQPVRPQKNTLTKHYTATHREIQGLSTWLPMREGMCHSPSLSCPNAGKGVSWGFQTSVSLVMPSAPQGHSNGLGRESQQWGDGLQGPARPQLKLKLYSSALSPLLKLNLFSFSA